MDTVLLKGFAAGARVDLVKEVGARLDVVLESGSVARVEAPGSIAALERTVRNDGRDAVVDRVAYTWFNRIIALRFMDANGYTGVGVVSPEAGKFSGQPQVLSDAKGGEFDAGVVGAKTQATITALLNGTRQSADPQGEAYGLLLETYCRFWNKAMPFMFEREGDYTELLMPTALLAANSVRDRAVRTLTDEVCREVEVIGWLYQFYISERKAEVFAGFKKNKKAGAAEIPAATQLFTPHWIVRYLVENSLGRLWLLNHPESRLAEQMDYYIPAVDEETNFLKVSSPEELKIIDPAAGSGHMLTYAFDLLYAIYEEQAYSPSEIPGKILEHNLYGAEIDPRAGALAAFALTMKAAKRRKLFLKNPVQPHICVLENIRFEQADLDFLWSLTSGSVIRSDVDAFWNAFEHADTFGSLIQLNETLIPVLVSVAELLESTGNLLATPARRVLEQAEQLSTRYHVVVANPPYMGTRNMNDHLREFAERHFPVSTGDLCTMFLDRSVELALQGGLAALVVSESWLFNASYEDLREEIVRRAPPFLTACIDKSAFGVRLNTAATVLKRGTSREVAQFFRVAKEHIAAAPIAGLPPLGEKVVAVRIDSFADVPGGAFTFDMPAPLLALYKTSPTVGSKLDAKQGLATADNGRFVRFWWEVSGDRVTRDSLDRTSALDAGGRWFPYNKGGTPTPWWGNQDHVVNWESDGREVRAFGTESGGRPRSAVRNPDFYFKPSVTWSNIGSGGARFRAIPAGFVFDVAGMSVFARSSDEQLGLLGYLNSTFVRNGLDVLAPTLNYQVGDVARLPLVLGQGDNERVSELVQLSRSMWGENETAHAFQVHVAANGSKGRLRAIVETVHRERLLRSARIAELEKASDEYWSHRVLALSGGDAKHVHHHVPRPLDLPSASEDAQTLVSYGVGCMFGRFSLDATGLVLANQGDTLQEYLAKVPSPSFMPDVDGVIPVVDGEWFEDDIVAKFRKFLRVAFGDEHFEENLQFVTDSLGVKDLRDYFVKSFYKDHVQRYKKRPIYWKFSSPRGSFNALVYLHRYNPSTVSTVLNEYLREFIKKFEVSLEQQERIVVSGASNREIAVAQKEAERLRKVLIELGDYERDLYDLASHQIELDLDDGVLVNYQKLGAALKDIGLKKGGENA
ncbi:BREX-1 system adenine-specific DNA-methyltransferase PglX [Microbacterium profundi]|uniref:site-specific DNA-methyltransferase (adenine-specific) n=1 Tax=Microbacterium profundi TaxID=450380 RepID=A0ABV3LHP3_9MICO